VRKYINFSEAFVSGSVRVPFIRCFGYELFVCVCVECERSLLFSQGGLDLPGMDLD
jgi:hypothetical protein